MPNPAQLNAETASDGIATSWVMPNTNNALIAGNWVIVPSVSFADTGIPTLPTCTDNKGNTFTAVVSKSNTGVDGTRCDLFVSPVPIPGGGYAAGTYTVTVNGAGHNINEMGGQLQQWSGFGTIGIALDTSGVGVLPVSTASFSVTTSGAISKQPVEALIAIMQFADSNTPDGIVTPTGYGTWVLDYADTSGVTNLAWGVAHQVTSATGSTATATWSGLDTSTNNGGTGVIAALYPGSPPGSGSPLILANPQVLDLTVQGSMFRASTKAPPSGGPSPRTIFIMP
jgi:hypothetical protein